MRPDKKGLWLFKTAQDELRAINIDENLRTTLGDSIEQFESIFKGFEWLGPAHPPKKVIHYYAENIIGVSDEHQGKPIVFREDIEEFLLKGDEND